LKNGFPNGKSDCGSTTTGTVFFLLATSYFGQHAHGYHLITWGVAKKGTVSVGEDCSAVVPEYRFSWSVKSRPGVESTLPAWTVMFNQLHHFTSRLICKQPKSSFLRKFTLDVLISQTGLDLGIGISQK